MDRVLQGAPSTVSATFTLDGVGTNPTPDTATLGITRADGTVLVAPGTSATNGVDGLFTYQLTTTHTALLDTLTIAWTSNLGTVETVVEVVGGFLFPVAEALADSEFSGKTAAQIAKARTTAEQAFEHDCGVAFVPRYERETLFGPPYRLKWSKLRTVRDGTYNGTALTDAELELLVSVGSSVTYSTLVASYGFSPYASTYNNRITLGYEHGRDMVPGEVSRAVLRLTKHYLLDWTADDRALRLDTADASYVMAVPGTSRWQFGIPEVDAVANRYRVHGV